MTAYSSELSLWWHKCGTDMKFSAAGCMCFVRCICCIIDDKALLFHDLIKLFAFIWDLREIWSRRKMKRFYSKPWLTTWALLVVSWMSTLIQNENFVLIICNSAIIYQCKSMCVAMHERSWTQIIVLFWVNYNCSIVQIYNMYLSSMEI